MHDASRSCVATALLSAVAWTALSAGAMGQGATAAIGASRSPQAAAENFAGRLEFEGRSDYSHIRIRRRGTVRSMLFVRDSGEEALESQIDLRRPYELRFEYLRHLFTSYLFCESQRDVLIVGLGGGGMVHFLRQFDPQLRIDAVEIDPLVVRLADQYFGVRSGETVNVITADGFRFIEEGEKLYDVIYMDAFLKPSAETDSTGVPLHLRTQQFYTQLQGRLRPGGVVAFNLNPHQELTRDIAELRQSFSQVYEFVLPGNQGVAVIASLSEDRLGTDEIRGRARILDKRPRRLLEFEQMAARLRH